MAIVGPHAITAALDRLGVRRMLLAIHDASFPSDPDEDVGRGSPSTHAAERLFAYARSLGFTGIQLGPQGQTSRDNFSPYDGTMFSRHLSGIALASFRRGRPFEGLLRERSLANALADAGPAQPRRAHDAIHAIVDKAYAALAARPDLVDRLARFRRDHAAWLERDALYAALLDVHGTGFRDWPEPDARLWDPRPGEQRAFAIRRGELVAAHARAIDRYAFGQLLAHDEHARVRAICARHGLVLYGDLQVGFSDGDAWAYGSGLLRDYAMGAPPSRTNPAGQPWNYPVLDPDQYASAAGWLVAARIDKAFAEYDSLRIDHPHGLVCPWVYRRHTADAGQAVRDGARLFESPDLPDHRELARYAIVSAEQVDRSVARYDDRAVRDLTPEQVARYATLFDEIVASATRHGRSHADISCEVLSTMPYPLACVLARHGFGRWRVTQKANLDDPGDVYRAENAAPEDWVMIGNHDTPSVFELIRGWSPAVRERWARHLAQRLAFDEPDRLDRPGVLASAMFAELLISRAESISVFFADLFGYEQRFNAPGTYNEINWTLRLPADFEQLHRDRLANQEAIDIPLALELALRDG